MVKQFCLITIGFAFCSLVLAGNEWEQIYSNVFVRNGEPLSFDEVLDSLKRLEATFTTGRDPALNFKLKNVQALIAASEVNENKCLRSAFSELDRLLEYNSPSKVNVIPYLNVCREKLFESCKSKFVSGVRVAVDRLELSERERMSLLGGIIDKIQSQSCEDDSHRTQLARIVLAYLQRQRRSPSERETLMDKRRGREAFGRLAQSTLGNVCFAVKRALEPYMFILAQPQIDKLDAITVSWIKVAVTCREILWNFESFVRSTYGPYCRYTADNSRAASCPLIDSITAADD